MSKRISRRVNKRKPVDDTPMYPYPELPTPPLIWDTVSRWLNTKTEPEIRQALTALAVVAQEHRKAGREEQALMAEAHITPIRRYLAEVLPKLIAERKGGNYTIQ